MAKIGPGDLAARLARTVEGDVLFDAASRGRYATDASIYQVEPIGVLVPKSVDDVRAAIALCREQKVPLLPRGAGSSQCGQTVGAALVIDQSKNLNRIGAFDHDAMTIEVEPGVVLDQLNAHLKPHGVWFPVDVSTSAQATLGGMAGNNSCGSRSIAYGNMVHNVVAIDAILSDGTEARFGTERAMNGAPPRIAALVRDLDAIGAREREEIERKVPKVLRRVGGYNIDVFHPQSEKPYMPDGSVNYAQLLVGSEGTLAWTRGLALKLAQLPANRVLGVVNFPSLFRAMECAQHIVKLGPAAVELVDRTMIGLARDNPAFRPVIERALIGEPDAVLLVEFIGDARDAPVARLRDLVALMGDLGLPGSVVEMTDAAAQKALWDVRKAGLNIMMSLKGDGKPVSFIEDCAVPLEHLAEYTRRLTEVFEKNGTRGTWYAHAAVGCLHVRPVLNLRLDRDVKAMRAIAEEAFAMVREYKGSHSGEHGDGIVRSEFHERMFGTQLVGAFEEVKRRFDPNSLFNPGKIVHAPKFDDRRNFRYGPGYRADDMITVLDWSAYSGAGRGFQGAVEMCNNNGACRALAGGVMCPSYRVTRQEKDVTRGRANTLRLAIAGQLGLDAFTSDEMMESLKLCVSCKGCRRECPTGVDMARMKIEVLAARAQKYGLTLHDRLVGWLPRYARYAAAVPWLLNLRDALPGAARLSEAIAHFSARRTLPRWRRDVFRDREAPSYADAGAGHHQAGREVVLFADTFNRHFERENLDDAIAVLNAGGYRVHIARPADGSTRPLCCGRTFLAIGKVDEARREAERVLAAVEPFVSRGIPVVGLEPSCLLGFRDEVPAIVKDERAQRLATHALLFEEFLAREAQAGRLDLPLAPLAKRALVHGHCHQKAFAAMGAVETVLRLVPGLAVDTLESSCCGMAGSFGYDTETIDVSLAMGELSLLPAVRAAPADAIVVADGTSCRHQIKDGAGREAVHVAWVLAQSLAARHVA